MRRGARRPPEKPPAWSQASILDDIWPPKARWFVIGGPGHDCEAQYLKARHPEIRCVGFEPCAESCSAQITGRGLTGTDTPFPGSVHQLALWSSETELELMVPQGGVSLHRCAIAQCHPADPPDLAGASIAFQSRIVPARTLDQMSDRYGPFEDVVLWLDVEYAELEALNGAIELLKRTLMINIETFSHLNLSPINTLLSDAGFILRRLWNVGETPGKDAQDYIYVRAGRIG